MNNPPTAVGGIRIDFRTRLDRLDINETRTALLV